MSALTSFSVAGPAFTSTHLAKRQARRSLRCFASGEDDAKLKNFEPERKLSFEPNKRTAIGFVEEDSAGQTNIFAVEPKSYVQGTKVDDTNSSANDTFSLAAIAGTVAAGAIVAGLITVSGTMQTEIDGPSAEFKSLTAYRTQFTAELAAVPAAAPALSE